MTTPYERVKLSRERTAGVFPFPSAVDCIRYALQELCEYDDALMRQEQPDHKRNNEREHDPRKELGQAGYMIISAMLKVGICKGDYYSPQYGSKVQLVGAIAQELGQGLCNHHDGTITVFLANNLDWSLACWTELCNLHDWEPDALIDDTCARFETKHAPGEAR